MILASKDRQGSKSSRFQSRKKYQNPNDGSRWDKCGNFPGILVQLIQAVITDKHPNLRGLAQ